MRRGYWIILDELNLAPTDVLEALNRLLDDNRELFVAETQEVIKAHPGFMLFATQNPPGLYGGRKVQLLGLNGCWETGWRKADYQKGGVVIVALATSLWLDWIFS